MAFFTSKVMEFLPERIEKYSLQNTSKESKLLAELNRETWAKVMIPRMLSGHLQGRVLSMISKMISPETIIEIGDDYNELFINSGGQKLDYVESLNYSDLWSDAIISIIK